MKDKKSFAGYLRQYISIFIIFLLFLFNSPRANDKDNNVSYVTFQKVPGALLISQASVSLPLVISKEDFPGVHRVVKQLQSDIKKITGSESQVLFDNTEESKEIVLIGTIGRNSLIDKLIKEEKVDVKKVKDKWETFLIQIVKNPFPDVDRALIIAGSDKRGTIYGMYDLSEKIGVSPWYWWADVPVKKHSDIFIKTGSYTSGEPKVKYRGIFLNDEAPALTGWVNEKFGGYNSKFYEKIYELILRLKGNYLWPAMWDNSLATDDPENPRLADEYGVVIGTSHHEPMMRAWKEWERAGHKKGSWDYTKNETILRDFWEEGIRRTKDYEKIVTLGMRGDGDEAMEEGANINLLEKIVKDQREILADVSGKDVTSVPQVWALYKEVQEYYEKGMRVPDDVTLLLCDDNWGNIRILPDLKEKPRKGGYGIYYHFDYVGAPRNYKWVNTNQIERTWEQMHLAYEYGARQIWIVNVGDLKPMEFPINFFLDYAWNPEKIHADDISDYYRKWAEEQFGEEFSSDIADLISKYTKYNSRRKPELLSPDTYSLTNYREAERVLSEYNELLNKAEQLNQNLPEEYRDAFYQLVLHPIEACANLNELYFTVAKNHLYSKQGRSECNSLAVKAKIIYVKDSAISFYYNNKLAGGKWNHMMDQTHIGYTYWQQPDFQVMPKVKNIEIPVDAEMGVAVEGSEDWFPQSKELKLPEFDKFNRQKYYIEIFNRGKTAFDYAVTSGHTWIQIDESTGTIETEKRIWISIDWDKIPAGFQSADIKVNGPGSKTAIISIPVSNPASPSAGQLNGFVESNGFVSIEAEHYANAINVKEINWITIPNIGRTLSGITPFPVEAERINPGDNTPGLEYKMYLFNPGDVNVYLYFSPTMNFKGGDGLHYGISFDDEDPQIVNVHQGDTVPDWKYPKIWMESVANNIRITSSKHSIDKAGEHVLKFRMVDPGLVLQKIVIDTGNLKQTYLGPPESYNQSVNNKRTL